MSVLLHLLWSFVERMLPRASSALVMLLLTGVVTPTAVGTYALAMFWLLVLLASTDVPARQLSVAAVLGAEGRGFLRNYRKCLAVGGTLYMSSVLLIMLVLLPGPSHVVAMVPLVLVPGVVALRVEQVARMQLAGRWRSLAVIQSVAAGVSLLVSVPLLYWTHSVVAAALQYLLTEGLVTAQCLRQREVSSASAPQGIVRRFSIARQFRYLSFYSVLSFCQSQLERVLIASVAGAGALGLYSVAQAVGRSAGDAAAVGACTYLRTELGSHHHDEDVRRTCAPILQRAVVLSGLLGALTIIGADLILVPLMRSSWQPALDAVPVMVLALPAVTLGWCVTELLVVGGRLRRATPIKLLGVAAAIPVALAASRGVQAVAWAGFFRELLIVALMLALSRQVVPARVIWTAAAMTLGLLTLARIV